MADEPITLRQAIERIIQEIGKPDSELDWREATAEACRFISEASASRETAALDWVPVDDLERALADLLWAVAIRRGFSIRSMALALFLAVPSDESWELIHPDAVAVAASDDIASQLSNLAEEVGGN